MAVGNIFLPVMPARDINGARVSGALIYFFANGTTTPKTVYADDALTTPHPQPVVADAAGTFPPIYADSAEVYSAVAYTAAGVMLPHGSYSSVRATESAAIAAAITAELAAEAAAAEAAASAVDAANAVIDATPDIILQAIAAIADGSTVVDAAVASYLADRVGGAWFTGDGAPDEDLGLEGDYYRQTDTNPREVWYRDSGGWVIGRDVFASIADDVGLPVPAYVSWRMADADGTKKLIANSATAVAVPNNIIRVLTNGTDPLGVVSGNGATVTLAGANDPDGAAYAWRTQSTNVNGATQLTATIAAGTYTCTWQARSHDQSSTYTENFLFGADTATKGYTGAYNTLSRTFTLASPTGNLYPIYRNTTGDVYDIDVAKIRLNVGSSDLGIDAPGGHLMFGPSRDDASNPSFSSGFYRQYGVAQLPTSKSFSSYTITTTIKQDGDTGGTPSPAVCGDDYTQLNFGSQSNYAALRVNGAVLASIYGRLKGIGPASIACRVRNGSQEIYIDGAIVYAGTAATTPYVTKNLLTQFNGGAGANPLPSGDGYGNTDIIDSYLTDDKMYRAIASIEQASDDDGNPVTKPTHSLLFFGDSLTADNSQVGASGTGSWAHRYMATHATTIGNVTAVAGTGLASGTATTALYKSGMEISVRSGVIPIVVWCFGANDGLVTTDPVAYYAATKVQWDIIRATGAKLLVIGLWPQNSSAWNTAKETFNNLLRANTSDYDGFYDTNATAAGLDAAPAAGVYYYDFAVHLNGAGYDLVSPGIATKIATIIASL